MNNTPKNSRSITIYNASPQEIAEFIREVNGKEIRKFKVVYDDGRVEQKRLFVNGDRIGYLAPRKKKNGYLFELQGVYAISCDLPREVDRNVQFERNAKRLMELKNIIIKYCPAKTNENLLNAALFDIYACEAGLESHCKVEDYIFVPAILNLERRIRENEK